MLDELDLIENEILLYDDLITLLSDVVIEIIQQDTNNRGDSIIA